MKSLLRRWRKRKEEPPQKIVIRRNDKWCDECSRFVQTLHPDERICVACSIERRRTRGLR